MSYTCSERAFPELRHFGRPLCPAVYDAPLREPTGQAVGLCLEAHDLAISKYVAGREKDLDFTFELARRDITSRTLLLERLKNTVLTDVMRKLVRRRIALQFHM
jgi:hypothetical protein